MENPAGGNRGARVFQKDLRVMSHEHTTTVALCNRRSCASDAEVAP
jgi:hypothetical protein